MRPLARRLPPYSAPPFAGRFAEPFAVPPAKRAERCVTQVVGNVGEPQSAIGEMSVDLPDPYTIDHFAEADVVGSEPSL